MSVQSVGVVGAGTMGAGIAQVAVTSDCTVQLLDADERIVDRAIKSIHQRLERMVEKGRLSRDAQEAAVADLLPSVRTIELADCDLVIEAIVEDLEIKKKVFTELQEHCRPECVFATNTSSLSISKLADSLRDPSRLVGMHFFNPAPLMPLVEIVAGEHSRPSAVELAFETAVSWGKTAVRAKDTPGFIVNRVARPYYLEALRIIGEGLADVATVDRVMCELGGFRLGPFQLMDLVGIDVNYAVSKSVYEQFGRPARLTPHEFQARLVEAGHLGKKTGQGFYDYSGDEPTVAFSSDVPPGTIPSECESAVRQFTEKAGVSAPPNEGYIFARILTGIFNEAHLALEQGTAVADDIDLAMQKGTNYPHGPIAWSQQIGAEPWRAAFGATRGSFEYDAASIAAVIR